jgi:hypothetical protein
LQQLPVAQRRGFGSIHELYPSAWHELFRLQHRKHVAKRAKRHLALLQRQVESAACVLRLQRQRVVQLNIVRARLFNNRVEMRLGELIR